MKKTERRRWSEIEEEIKRKNTEIDIEEDREKQIDREKQGKMDREHEEKK